MRRAFRHLRHRLWLVAHRAEQHHSSWDALERLAPEVGWERTATGWEMKHAEDRATRPEWGPLG